MRSAATAQKAAIELMAMEGSSLQIPHLREK
jgi:hypothetical protein